MYQQLSQQGSLSVLVLRQIAVVIVLITQPNLSSPKASAQTPDVTRSVEQWGVLDNWCRGGSGDDLITSKACELRELVGAKLERANWCYGKEGDQGYQMKWHACEAGSHRPIAPPGSRLPKESMTPTFLAIKVTDTLMDGGIKEVDVDLAEHGRKRTVRGVFVNCGKTGASQVVLGKRQWSINPETSSVMAGPKGFPATEVWRAVCR